MKQSSNKELYIPSTIIRDGVINWLHYLEDNGFIKESSRIYNNKDVMEQLVRMIWASETPTYQVKDFTETDFIMCPFKIGEVTIQNERELELYQQTVNQLLDIRGGKKK